MIKDAEAGPAEGAEQALAGAAVGSSTDLQANPADLSISTTRALIRPRGPPPAELCK